MGAVSSVLDVFTSVGTWFASSMGSLLEVFYAEGQLTFFGGLAAVAVGIGTIMLILNKITDFIRLR